MRRCTKAGSPAEVPLSGTEAGQTLLEILLAFSASILVLSAVILGVITSLSNTQYTKNQGLANSYAQEGMAVVRQIRDSSWSKFSTYKLTDLESNTRYCINKDLEIKEVSYSANCTGKDSLGNDLAVGMDGIFSREVMFEHNSSSCCPDNTQTCDPNVRGSKTTVTVSWFDNKCPSGANINCHSVELITCFSSIDSKQAP